MAAKLSYYIDAPVKSVFDYFVDPAKSLDVMPLGTEADEVKVTKEGTGTFMSWHMKIAGVPLLEGFDVITEVVPEKHVTEKSSNALVGTWDYWFEQEGAGTKLTMEHRARSFWGMPPLSNVMDYAVARMTRSYIPRLKAKIEAESTKPGPKGRKAPGS